MKLHAGIITGMLAAAILAGCQAAPVTGRNQLIVLPESQDSQLGLEAYQQILSESEVSNDPELNRRVKEVGRRIAAASPQPEAEAPSWHCPSSLPLILWPS
jgi:predicted Zn-dependent protease